MLDIVSYKSFILKEKTLNHIVLSRIGLKKFSKNQFHARLN